MNRQWRMLVVVAAVVAGGGLGHATVGCGSPEEASNGVPDAGTGGEGARGQGAGGQGTSGQGGGGAGPCGSASGYDPVAAGLPICCDTGAAHCVPESEVPPSLAPAFSTCDSGGAPGLCLPDSVIKAGKGYKPAPCASLGDTAGVCLSKCIKQVAEDPAAGLLEQGTCASDELCVPCINPISNETTGACEIDACGSGGSGGGGSGGGGSGGGTGCPHEGPPVVDPAMFGACSPACGGAHCVPEALVPPDQQSQLAACTAGGGPGFCTPDTFIAAGGNFIPSTCVSLAGAEGRCLSVCVPQVAAQVAILPQATCGAEERCVPCFDPTTQAATGACTQSCDPGPQEPPVVITCPYSGPPVIDASGLSECSPACGGAHCVPEALIPAELQSQLAVCPGGFCAPDSVSESGGQGLPATCTSVAGAEGRCLSTCLPAIAEKADLLPQSTCPAGEKCAPCFDPTGADPTAATGACSIACDAAADPPVVLTCPWNGPEVIDPSVFPACSPACGGAHCVPSDLVPPAQQADLATCAGGFCLPDVMTEKAGNYVPPSCTPFAGTMAEGRCLSECLPSVAAQASVLVKDICATGEKCVPCFDPYSGESTGACSTSCDAPQDPPYTFPTCCPSQGMDQGTCSPKAAIPAAQQSNLKQLTCPAEFLCVPNEYLPDPPVPISTCTTLLGPGACVSQCTNVPAIFLQGSCSDNHLCVTCWMAPSTPGCP